MKNILSAIGAIVIMAGIVGGIVLYVGVGSNLIDPHKLYMAVIGRLQYPDNLFGGK